MSKRKQEKLSGHQAKLEARGMGQKDDEGPDLRLLEKERLDNENRMNIKLIRREVIQALHSLNLELNRLAEQKKKKSYLAIHNEKNRL